MTTYFISYNCADKAWAEWIAWQIEAGGDKTVIQAWDFRPGSKFILDMQEHLAVCDRMVAVLSPSYLEASFTWAELAVAMKEDPKGEQGTLVPVLVRACEPKGLLGTITYIDLEGLDNDTARETLISGLNVGRVKPTVEPGFPGQVATPEDGAPRFPGALPPVWNVPHARNPNFTGRADLLDDLGTALRSGAPAALTQAISGLGGVGKTQMALEYCYRYADEYDYVWWIPSEEEAPLASELAALADPLELPEANTADQGATVAAVRHWLGQNGAWLLVFDNAPGPESVEDYLPQGATGHVIITSRNPNWGAAASSLSVTVLERSESVEFLTRRTGEDDDVAADALADALGDLPLALEQAGAYMEETGMSLSSYLDLFRTRRSELWKREHEPTAYADTVATTWDLSMYGALEKCPACGDLMKLCAYLAPDDIPQDVVREGARHLPESFAGIAADEIALGETVAALRLYSLIDVGGDSLSVHRMVQATVRDRLSSLEQQIWTSAGIDIINEAFPYDSDDVTTWATCARLLPHALAATGLLDTLEVVPGGASRLLNQVGLYLKGRAEHATAKSTLERSLAIREAAHGPDDPDVATGLGNLGGVLLDLGEPKKALPLLERSLAIKEAAYGPDHPGVATGLNNLASVLRALGEPKKALPLFERALAIDEEAYGTDHPEVATDLSNLAGVLRVLGEPKKALPLLERALAINEAARGPDHPAVATGLSNLGVVLKALDDLEGARSLCERALAIDEASYGREHPNVAIRVNNLASVLKALGDLEGARSLCERALAIDEASYGREHPNVAIRVNNLAGVLRVLGEPKKALPLLERALAIKEAAYGPDHPGVATGLNNLASVLRALGEPKKALPLYERALVIFETSYGSDHPDTEIVRGNLELLERL